MYRCVCVFKVFKQNPNKYIALSLSQYLCFVFYFELNLKRERNEGEEEETQKNVLEIFIIELVGLSFEMSLFFCFLGKMEVK